MKKALRTACLAMQGEILVDNEPWTNIRGCIDHDQEFAGRKLIS
ncbi:MAG: hypothetical protein ACUVWY_03120 [Desulfosoma sp.]